MLLRVDFANETAILRLGASRLGASFSGPLRRCFAGLREDGCAAALVDLTGVRMLTAAGLAALYEAYGAYCEAMQIGFFGASDKVQKVISRHGLSKVLPHYGDLAGAMAEPQFRSRQLSGTKAVVLCAGEGSRMRPLSADRPKPMLDILGAPVLERLLDHLGSFGVRDFHLNPGYLGDQLHLHFRSRAGRSIFFANEGSYSDGVWSGAPAGSASTLARLQRRHSAFDGDFFVLCGDALTDLDMAALMRAHKESGAEVTIAAARVPRQEVCKYGILDVNPQGRVTGFQEKPKVEEARSCLASTGVYVFSPAALRRLEDEEGLDIAMDLLPRILARGGRIQSHSPDFIWADIGNPADYFSALQRGLTGTLPGVCPAGEEVKPGLWLAPGAKVSPRARILGPCYAGPGARILAGAELQGSCVIGAECVVEGKTLLRDSVLMPGTKVTPGVWLEAQIAAPGWSLGYGQAASGAVKAPPVTGLVPARAVPAAGWGRMFQAG